MDAIILADKSSETQKLESSGGVKDVSYSMGVPYPIFGKAYDEIPPQQDLPVQNPHGNFQTFRIPPGYFVNLARLKLDYTSTFATEGQHKIPVACDLIDYIQIKCNSQQLFEMTGSALKAHAMDLPPVQRDFHMRYACPLDPDTETTTNVAGSAQYTSYWPIDSSFFSGLFEKCMNTNIVDLEVIVKYKTSDSAGLVVPLTLFSSSLMVYRWAPESSVYDKLLADNWSSPLRMECWNTTTEVIPITTNSTVGLTGSLIHRSNCEYNVFKTVIYMAKSSGTAASVYGCPMQHITKLSANVGGKPYLDNVKKSQMNFEAVMRGRSDGTVNSLEEFCTGTTSELRYSTGATECFVIDWSALCGEDRNSGSAFFKKLSNPTFNITYKFAPKGAGGADNINTYSINVVHFYWQILGIEGKIAKVLANN